jgi:hypothetical protein
MKALTRYAVLAAAPIMALTLGVASSASASAAAASSSSPVLQKISGPSSFGITNPCNGAGVSTTGQIKLFTLTSGTHTVAGIVDSESGDGYTVVIAGAGAFNSLASSYPVDTEGVWVNSADPALDFHAGIDFTIEVNASNAPIGGFATSAQPACGL